MRNLADIKYRIKGISQTRQITGAMETVSVAKMRKAMQKYRNNILYFNRLLQTARDIAAHSGNVRHKYLTPAQGGRAVFIVIAGEKGLAGGFNHNLLEFAWNEMQKSKERYIFTVGQPAREFFEQRKASVDIEFLYATHNPSQEDAAAIAESVVNLYGQGFMDEVYVIYTAMETSLSMRPECVKLLPLTDSGHAACHGDTVPDPACRETCPPDPAAVRQHYELYYEPAAGDVLDALVPEYLTGALYGCLLQSAASEHSSRVTAMSSATRNADEIIEKLNVAYHRARQEAVTNEMLEIMSAAGGVR